MTSLPSSFRLIRLELAREKSAPAGDRHTGYDILAPLDGDGHLDAAEWKAHAAACRVRRFETGREDIIGRLRRRPGGGWFIDYAEGDEDDEAGFRFGDERFVAGEYVSIRHGVSMHTFRVVSVSRP